MEHRDLQPLAQLGLDRETLGRLDVFEIDATERRFERRDDLDQLVRVALGQFDVEDVDAGKLLEQAALALHHRLGGQWPDVAQAEHRRPVGDHADEVAAAGVVGRQQWITLDLEAGIGHARRIGERKVALVGERLGGIDGDLAARGRTVVLERRLAQHLFGIGQGLAGDVVHRCLRVRIRAAGRVGPPRAASKAWIVAAAGICGPATECSHGMGGGQTLRRLPPW